MITVTTAEARDRFADLVNRARYGGERIIVTRAGKPAVAIVSIADLEALRSRDPLLNNPPLKGRA